jgi:NADH dehydrogenase [ubiquinone] 1 alpha subcomplex assembly factor 5
MGGRRFKRALVIGCPNGLEQSLVSLGEAVDFADSLDSIEPAEFDLTISLGELETAPDPGLHLFILAQALRAGGMIAGVVVGGASLPALRSALLQGSRAGGRAVLRVHPMIDGPALSALLSSAGVADAVIDVDRIDVAYRSLDRLVADLRAMGCTNILAERRGIIRPEWEAARNAFLDGADQRVERFELLHFTGWVRGAWKPVS